ncbi:MAG: hypothetical protein ACLR6J_02620 [Parabacteroides merdae]
MSKKKQDTAKEIMTFLTKVKNFFGEKRTFQEKTFQKGKGKDVLLLEFEPINN